MPPTSTLAILFSLLTVAASAQTAPIARVLHPTPPLPSYDVATIKPYDANAANMPNGARRSGVTARAYIRSAYSPIATILTPGQVVGGPVWIDKDQFVIEGKPSAELQLAMQKMNSTERSEQTHAMQQSLLADRFHLKVHFEVREMPVYALVPAKGGLKIKALPEPDPVPPANSPASGPQAAPHTPTMSIMMGGSSMEVRATGTSIIQLAGLLGSLMNQYPDFISLGGSGNRPIIDQTGFTGTFDLPSFKWANPQATTAPGATPSDAPALSTALEETLGLKLISTKGPVEVVVIDSIDHPSDN